MNKNESEQNENESEHKKKESFFLQKARTDGTLSSPIDLLLTTTTPLEMLDDLQWSGLEDRPKKMKLFNSGKTVVVTGRWSAHRPTLSCGFLPDGYVFSQVHFHWGRTDHEGSEHKVNGASFPMEMHVMMFRACYKTQDVALTREDGVVVLAYLIELGSRSTPGLRWLADHLPAVIQANSSAVLPPSPFSSLVVPFTRDYLAYWGAVSTGQCSHPLLWLVSSNYLTITSEDLQVWRTVQDLKGQPLEQAYGATHSSEGTLFHVKPSPHRSHPFLFSMDSQRPDQKILAPCRQSSKDEINTIRPTTSYSDVFVCESNKGAKKLEGKCLSNDERFHNNMSTTTPVQPAVDMNQKRLTAATRKRLENVKKTGNLAMIKPVKRNKQFINILKKKSSAKRLHGNNEIDMPKHNFHKQAIHQSKNDKQIGDESVSPKKDNELRLIQEVTSIAVPTSGRDQSKDGRDAETLTKTKKIMKSKLPMRRIEKQKAQGSEPQALLKSSTNQSEQAEASIQCSSSKSCRRNLVLHPPWMRGDLTTTIPRPRPSCPRPLSAAIQSSVRHLDLTSRPQTSNLGFGHKSIENVEKGNKPFK